MATGNDYRKVRALLAKTVAAGCTEGEAVSALETALKLIGKHGLDMDKLNITVPEGHRIDGQTVVKVEPASAEKPKTTAPKAPRITRGERLAEMAARPEGFTIEEVMAEFGILEHSARAQISIELRKKRGLNIVGKKGRYGIASTA